MDQDWQIGLWEAEYVYTHIRVAHLLFWNIEFCHCDHVAQVVFRASVSPVMVDVHLCHCASSQSVDSLLCQFGKGDSRPFDYPESLPGVFLSQPSPSYARET